MKELQESINRIGLGDAPELQDEAIVRKVFEYCILLWNKNQQMNLTRHTDFDTFVSRDLKDTLELSKLITQNAQVLDVGSGGGVPGMLLCIIRPDLRVTLTDSVKKKADALLEFATVLELSIEISNERGEAMLQDFRYDFTVARAVGPLHKICRWFEGHWLSAGQLLAIKGPKWPEERAEAIENELLEDVDLEKVAEYPTPGTEWSSVILQLRAKKDD